MLRYHNRMFRIAIALCLLPAFAQQQKEPPKEPTNLKVLKGASGAEVSQIMRTFTAGLGVQCVYCHIQGNPASDENPKKETARHMIELMKLVNAQFPDKKMHVTCYTCHRGEAEPKTAPEPRTGGQ
ncbi:MAG TPA: c-type cytochrome [Candidatus Solibacter sp.]|nr:c-type cytochrome [Candidatus Solibacter sp.]